MKIFFLVPILLIGVFWGQTSVSFGKKEAATAFSYADANVVIAPFVANATNGTLALNESYSLADEYPILQEDQQNSDFCWVYASLKALESSFMKQRNEYYNFSDVASALFAYKFRNYSGEFKSMSGNFDYFIRAAGEYGLVHESDFQTDNLNTITSANFQDYMYITDYADKSIISGVSTFNISNESNFSILTNENKAKVLKQYIKSFGGLYVSINGGYFYYENGSYFTKHYDVAQAHAEYVEIGGHALCLIGWDADGFLALNSWGYEQNSRYPLVHISEDESNIYNYVYGFGCGDDKVSTSSSSASAFKNKLKSATTNLNNFFCYGENISLTYTLLKSEYNSVSLKIYRGEQKCTDNFSITKSETESQIQILVSKGITDGGYYLLRFYDEGGNLITTKSIYVFSGTELAYFKFANKTSKSKNPPVYDSYVFAGGNLSSDRAVTIVTNTLEDCEFQFKMSPYCTNSTTNPLRFEVGQVYVSVMSGEQQTWVLASNLTTNKYFDNESNNYFIKVNDLTISSSQYIGEHLFFTVRVYSTDYEDYFDEYYFNLIYSPYSSYESGNLFNIIYHTDGEKNNPTNLEKYTSDLTQNEIIGTLNTKESGAKFIAWFDDDELLEQISIIDGDLHKNLQLFALFEDENGISYLECVLSLDSIFDENNNLVDDNISIYGYKQKFRFDFNVTDRLLEINENYIATYDCYVTHNGVKTHYLLSPLGVFTAPGTIYFTIQNLSAGYNTIEIVLNLNISTYFSLTKSYTYTVNVEKRGLRIIAEDAEFDYDGEIHVLNDNFMPSAKLKIDNNSILPQDRLLFVETIEDGNGNTTARDAGVYVYKIKQINNNNYTYPADVQAVLTINKLKLTVVWGELSANYDAQNHAPTFTLYRGSEISSITASTNYSQYIDAGIYNVKINENTLSNRNYEITNNDIVSYEILPATIVLQIENQEDRVQTVYWNRKAVNLQITNDVFDDVSTLKSQIQVSCEAFLTDKFGVYPILASTTNTNYVIEQNDANYTLTGHFKVTYVLPNGETYEENVDEGRVAAGVTKDIYNIGFFEGFNYSKDLNSINDDAIVRVTVQDYRVYAVVGLVFVVLIIIYFISSARSKKKRYA